MSLVRIWGVDSGDFAEGKLIWSALNALAPAKVTPPTLVDLSEVQLLRPYAATAIAALGCLAARRASLILPSTQAARDYVLRAGLSDFFVPSEPGALSHSPRAVPVRHLTGVSSTFADEITRAWEREFGGMPGGLRPRLADHLDEVVRNALSHAESLIGCLVAAQVYPSVPSVEVAVLDLGQSIRVHLTKNPAYSHAGTDAEAVVLATGEGVTGTPPGRLNRLGEPNSGVGLFELRQYCESGGGQVTIASGEAMVTFGPDGGPDIRHFAGGFPGCLVNIRFRV